MSPGWDRRTEHGLGSLILPSRLRVIATVQDPLAVQAILAHLHRSGAPEPPGPPTRLGRNRVDSSLDQAPEASLSPPAPAPEVSTQD